MGQNYQKYSREFRETALRRLELAPNVAQLCRELGVSRQLLYQWRDTERRERQKQSQTAGERLRQENRALKKSLVKKTLEADFLKAACEKVAALGQANTGSGATASGKAIREMMPAADSLGIEPMCRLAQVSRAGFYRFLQPRYPGEEEMEVRNTIQQIVLEHRHRYGYRRVAVELRRRGMVVNRKRVLRLMREDNLLGVQPAAFVVTTDSDHDQQVYLNLARRMKLTAINQLWVADITYIRLRQEFVYLAVVLDAFSRKVVGWALDRTLTTRLPLLALSRAITLRQPAPGLVHHSDRGVQYCSEQYTSLLAIHGIVPSMSRPGNPYENAFCESFIKTLKREQIYAHKYQYIDELNARLEEFIEQYYNRLRLHSALGYKTPEEFEAACTPQKVPAAPSVSFSRYGEIYRSWTRRRGRPPKANGEPVSSSSPPHRIDESPVGYSLTGCAPAEPVSASPTENHSDGNQTK